MDPIESLRKWRENSPAYLVGICMIPLAWHLGIFQLNEKLLYSVLIPAGAFLCKFIYNASDLGGALWREEMDQYVGKLIKDTIIGLAPDDLHLSADETRQLRKREIMKRRTGIFWETIDSDQRLSSHKEAFFNNGRWYSTSVDVFVIFGIIGYLYIAGFNLDPSLFYIIFGCAMIGFSTISWYLIIPVYRARHLALCEEQLEQLKRLKSDAVRDNIRRAVSEMRNRSGT